MFSISFIVVGLACIGFGAFFITRKQARITFSKSVQGKHAVVSGTILIAVGIAVIIFGLFVYPNLFEWAGFRNLAPQIHDREVTERAAPA